MLIVIVMTFFNCETESQNIEVDNSARINLENSFVTAAGACQSLSSVSKFANYSMYDTDFVIYDKDGNVLTSEMNLLSGETSALKSVNPETTVILTIRNSEIAMSKPMKMKICMLYTFVLDQNNRLTSYKSEL